MLRRRHAGYEQSIVEREHVGSLREIPEFQAYRDKAAQRIVAVEREPRVSALERASVPKAVSEMRDCDDVRLFEALPA
jgi:hypothetical protein